MTLRVVGAGVGRTGTLSLKLAFERLLGAPCYHMVEVLGQLDRVPRWQRAVDGEPADWPAVFDGYAATVDWPAAAFWTELAAAYPDAIVVLSTRADPETWWRSVEHTVLAATIRTAVAQSEMPPDHAGFLRMVNGVMTSRFCNDPSDRAVMTASYERHNAAVRAGIPPERLVDWRPGDGWAPLCAALGLPVPDEPFPHVNTTAEFRAMTKLDAPLSR